MGDSLAVTLMLLQTMRVVIERIVDCFWVERQFLSLNFIREELHQARLTPASNRLGCDRVNIQ